MYIEKLADKEKTFFNYLLSLENKIILIDEIKNKKEFSPVILKTLVFPRGLVYFAFEMGKYSNKKIIIPKDIYDIINSDYRKKSRFRKDKLIDSIEMFHEDISLIKDNENNIINDIKTFTGFCYGNKIKVLRSGKISKNQLRNISNLFVSEKEVNYASFIYDYCLKKNMIAISDDYAKVTDKIKVWEDSAVFSKIKDLFLFWLSYYDKQSGQSFRVQKKDKKILMDSIIITGLDISKWICVEKFYRKFFKEYADTDGINENKKSLLFAPETDKKMSIKIYISEGLYYLGFLRMGNPSYFDHINKFENEGAFSVTSLGKALFSDNPRLIEESQQPGEKHIILQPNLEIVAPPLLDYNVYLELCRFADIKSVSTTTIFSISKDSVRRGIDSGLSPVYIKDFLIRHSKNEIPPSYLDIINECKEKYGNIIIGAGGRYLITSNELIMKELRGQKELKKYFYRSLTSTVEILDPSSDLDKIVKILHDKGYMPEIEESDSGIEESQNINLSLKPDSFFVLRDAVKILLKIIYDRKMPTDYLNQLRILDDKLWNYESVYGEPSTSTFFKDFIDSFLEYKKKI